MPTTPSQSSRGAAERRMVGISEGGGVTVSRLRQLIREAPCLCCVVLKRQNGRAKRPHVLRVVPHRSRRGSHDRAAGLAEFASPLLVLAQLLQVASGWPAQPLHLLPLVIWTHTHTHTVILSSAHATCSRHSSNQQKSLIVPPPKEAKWTSSYSHESRDCLCLEEAPTSGWQPHVAPTRLSGANTSRSGSSPVVLSVQLRYPSNWNSNCLECFSVFCLFGFVCFFWHSFPCVYNKK